MGAKRAGDCLAATGIGVRQWFANRFGTGAN